MPNPTLTELAERYGLPSDGVAALEELLAQSPAGASVRVAGLPPTSERQSNPTFVLAPVSLDADDAPSPWALPARYAYQSRIGSGGFGEVLRVYDNVLKRALVMKLLHPKLHTNEDLKTRFIQEAQVTAQLDHPCVIPIHDLGQLEGGQIYYTMKEVRGRTFAQVISSIHAASRTGWAADDEGWSLRRLIDALYRVTQAVAYAHRRDVIHRDLKPENLMVGAFGEVLILDWGLARILSGVALPAAEVVSERSLSDSLQTQLGTVSGTLQYMSPEQARGEIDLLGPASDVYSLGAILYEILCGAAPYPGGQSGAIWRRVLQGPPPPLAERTALPLPEDLAAICERAMARDPDDRYLEADDMAWEIGAWLEGAKRSARGRGVVESARAERPRIDALRREAASLRQEAAALMEPLQPHDPIEAKRPVWEKEDRAEALEAEAEAAELGMTQLLQAAFTHQPDLPEAHTALAEHYQRAHAQAEAAGDRRGATRLERLLAYHDRGRYTDYLKGDGALELIVDPPDARVTLRPWVTAERRLALGAPRDLGSAPLSDLTLPMGRYLLTLTAPGCVETRYPVRIDRQERWTGAPPGAAAPAAIRLPREGELDPGSCYVPAGWWRRGHPRAIASLPEGRVWTDGFVIQRFPVTNGEYLVFLNELVDAGREDDALSAAPQRMAEVAGQRGELMFARGDAGRFALPEGLGADLPVFFVDWHSARAYAAWFAARTGVAWRLPAEMEWEKAARGVDGRGFPWGDFVDPTFARIKSSQAGPAGPVPVDSYPVDTSPYGVRGMAGNAMEWCLDAFLLEGQPLVDGRSPPPAPPTDPAAELALRGNFWWGAPNDCLSAFRINRPASFRFDCLGFRLARSL